MWSAIVSLFVIGYYKKRLKRTIYSVCIFLWFLVMVTKIADKHFLKRILYPDSPSLSQVLSSTFSVGQQPL